MLADLVGLRTFIPSKIVNMVASKSGGGVRAHQRRSAPRLGWLSRGEECRKVRCKSGLCVVSDLAWPGSILPIVMHEEETWL